MHKYIDSRYMFTYAFVCVYILYTILIYIAYFSVLFETKRKAKENSVNRINNVEVKKTLFLTKQKGINKLQLQKKKNRKKYLYTEKGRAAASASAC